MNEWVEWLRSVRDSLRRGAHVEVPAYLPPPPAIGFHKYGGITENVRQAGDWVLRMPSGARLHAHEFADGRWTLHLDRYDPDHSPIYTVLHVTSETRLGRLVAYCYMIFVGYRMVTA